MATRDSAADGRTRQRVVRRLLERGSATASTLASDLSLTPAGVRRHLDALTADGSVEAREAAASGSRGRPARVFRLSAAGRGQQPHGYDDLAASALRFLREQAGDEAVTAFARARVAALESRLRGAVEGRAPEERAAALAEALSGDGYAASTAPGGTGVQLCQHHCPVQSVAAEFPQLCEAETELFAALLGTHVQRLATLAHGDQVCTTHIPGTHIPGTGSSRHDTSTPRSGGTTP